MNDSKFMNVWIPIGLSKVNYASACSEVVDKNEDLLGWSSTAISLFANSRNVSSRHNCYGVSAIKASRERHERVILRWTQQLQSASLSGKRILSR